jgi:hypothetical protein
MPGRHPDDDVLADLAADVLPAVDARAVEAHVMSCDRCAALLEDAERVRGLLLADDPGPVPAQVWQRIEAALAAEAATGHVGAGPRDRAGHDANGHLTAGHDRSGSRSPAAGDTAADTAAFQAFVQAPDGAVHPPAPPLPPAPAEPAGGTAGWAEDADPLDDPARWAAPRAGRGGGTSRRRDVRTDGAGRRTPVLLAAAATVVLVAAVGGVTRLTSGGGASTSAGAGATGAQAGPSAAAGAEGLDDGTVVLRSKRAYREATLAQDAAALLTISSLSAAGGQGKATATKRATPSGLDAARAQMDASADDLTNPARLSSCLDALNVSQDRLIAIDLATYEGREAAILLLRTSDGGREVWAVERTCAPGNEGALKYARLSG